MLATSSESLGRNVDIESSGRHVVSSNKEMGLWRGVESVELVTSSYVIPLLISY